jgi:hypothetical protein
MLGCIFMFLLPDGTIAGYHGEGSKVVDTEQEAKVYKYQDDSSGKLKETIRADLALSWENPERPLHEHPRWKKNKLEKIRVWTQVVPY